MPSIPLIQPYIHRIPSTLLYTTIHNRLPNKQTNNSPKNTIKSPTNARARRTITRYDTNNYRLNCDAIKRYQRQSRRHKITYFLVFAGFGSCICGKMNNRDRDLRRIYCFSSRCGFSGKMFVLTR